MFDPGLARRVGSRRNAEAFRNVGKKSSHFMPPSSLPPPNEIMILAMERDGKNPRKREAKLSRIPIWPTRTAAMTPQHFLHEYKRKFRVFSLRNVELSSSGEFLKAYTFSEIYIFTFLHFYIFTFLHFFISTLLHFYISTLQCKI